MDEKNDSVCVCVCGFVLLYLLENYSLTVHVGSNQLCGAKMLGPKTLNQSETNIGFFGADSNIKKREYSDT